MAVNKIDPKVIFASEAPAQDTPAVFTNRTVGWGETRKNGGRPTIKQMNAEQQSTDLKILWLNENAVAPYDPTIDYPINAVTIKDDVFKIFDGSVWEVFLDKTDIGLGNVDNTSDLNKPISTSTQTALDLKADKSYVDTSLPHNNLINRNSEAAHEAQAILDATGKNQQTLNEMMLNTNLMYRHAVPNQNTVSIHTIFAAVANSLNDGDKLTIPSGNWYWNGQAVITKQINIECLGTINADYRVNSAHVVFQPPVDYTFNAFDFVTAMPKGAKKLTLKGTFAGNLSDYFVVMSSTEVAMHRAGFSEDYLKYLVFDITKDDFTLRDPLPFGINDLTKATLRLVKKRQPVQHRGFNFNTQNTDPTTTQGHSIMYNYASNVRVVDALINQGKNGVFGDAISISNSYNIQHENCHTAGERVQTDTTYNFLIYNSAYCNFHKCSNIQKGTGAYNSQTGIAGRYGYKITVDNCDLSRIDDHWGYDYLVINSNTENGVITSGGSVTIKNCTGDVIFFQRADPPFNEGTLTIEDCKYHSNLIQMLGHDSPVWASKDYATRKCFDVINIKNVTPIASLLNPVRTASIPKMILMRDPQLDETSVYRDTILNIDSVSLINDVGGVDPIQLIDCFNESEDKIYLNYDKKKMFSSINLTKVKALYLNGANPYHIGVPPICDTLNISNDCENVEFLRVRARVFNNRNSAVKNVGTGSRFFDCEKMVINGMDLSQLTTALNSVAKASRYYQSTSVHIYNSIVPSQLYIWNAFTNPANAVVEGINLKVATGNSIANYDMGGRGDPFIPDVRNYHSDLIVRYTIPSAITLAAGVESSVFQLNFANVKAADTVVGRFDIQQDIQVTVVAPTSYNNGLNKIYYKLKNTSAVSVTIPIGEFLTFRVV